MKKCSTVLIAIIVLLFSMRGHAATPPASSPIALGQHPRLFVTASELPALRDRISTYYATEFQVFINLLNDTSVLTTSQKAIEKDWGSLNYAFIALLDPQQMKLKGFTFTGALDTPQEYCAKANSYAQQQLTAISNPSAATSALQEHGHFGKGYPESTFLPVMTAYDWCYPHLSGSERTAIINAFIADYNKRYKGQNQLTMPIGASKLVYLANNWSSASIEDVLGILAFYNDPEIGASTQSEMYDAFYTIWLDRVFVELNRHYPDGTGWHESSGGYLRDGFLNIGIPTALFSSALGTDYITSTPFFRAYPRFLAANLKPHSLLKQCGPSGTDRCPEYLERWGDLSGGISGIECKTAILSAGMLRHVGNPNAAIAKWAYQDAVADGCAGKITKYGGTWSNAVLYWFLYGDREVTKKSPDQLNISKTQKLGLGEVVMKSGYGSTDSQVVFWAKNYKLFGHDTSDVGQFSIHKFGNLILKPANSKSGDALLASEGDGRGEIFDNAIGIHKGPSDPSLGYNRSEYDPFWVARGIPKPTRIAGTVMAETLNNPDFDYIAYDSSLRWLTTTADISQREFVYLRGAVDKEFVLVFDRLNVLNPSSDEKIWKIWIPEKPVFENGSPTNPRTGKWTSSNTDVMSLTNKRGPLKSKNFESAPTHGKFYMKTLLPSSIRINVLGGSGQEYQSGDDDGTTPWGAPSMTTAMHEYLGWGRIEVRPAVATNYDTFLNVIQFGDANSLASMSQTKLMNSTDNKMTGAHINDTTHQWVVLFAKNASDVLSVSSSTYKFFPAASKSKHLVVDMQPSTTYNISTTSGTTDTTVTISTTGGGVPVSSNSEGVLYFSLNGLTLSSDTTPPSSPINLTIK
ncbi:MAG: hypothetical protein ACE5GK_03060 [Nitrospiria bacterium]